MTPTSTGSPSCARLSKSSGPSHPASSPISGPLLAVHSPRSALLGGVFLPETPTAGRPWLPRLFDNRKLRHTPEKPCLFRASAWGRTFNEGIHAENSGDRSGWNVDRMRHRCAAPTWGHGHQQPERLTGV